MLIIQIDINNTNFKAEKSRRIVFNMKENTKNQPYEIELEQLTEPLWGYASENNGWKIVLDYISAHK